MKRFEFGRMSIMASVATVCLGVLIALSLARGASPNDVTCTVVTPVPHIFNAYDPTDATADLTIPTGSISVECDNTTSALRRVTFNLTLHTSPLLLSDGKGNTLTYGLYTNSPPTTPWNTTNKVTCTYDVAKNTKLQSACSFYGKIDKSQNVPAGVYKQNGLQVGGTWTCVPSAGAASC
jgi:spore coat protein U-like protein